MSLPKINPLFSFLILFSILAATTIGTAKIGADKGSSPQRLRVRIENQRLKTGDATKVIVEFLDRNYGQVVNDATRVIELGHASSGSRTSGAGKFDPYKIVVKPGAWSGEASFTSSVPGRLFITASSEGLEPGKALVLITADSSASLLTKFVSLFETVAHAQEDLGFEISPKELTATANGRHRADFNISFLKSPAPGTIVRITTNFTNGEILYKGERIGSAIADIKLEEGEDISGDISVRSGQSGKFDITASVRPDGPADQARVEFTPPRPMQVIFESEPMSIGTDACDIPLTVRLADDGGFPIEPDRERRIHFSRATESAQISFESESVVVAPGQPSAQVVFRLKELPLGNELKILAKSDAGIQIGQKTLVIKSAIEKLLISGPTEVARGGAEANYTIYLADKDDKHRAADWNRQIDLNVNGGSLKTTQVVIPKGERKVVVKYTSAGDAGQYVLTASSAGLTGDATHTISVINEGHWLALFALFGALVGGVARKLKKYKEFGRILPRWTGKYWDLGLVGCLAASLVGGLFFYWAFKLGFSQAFGSPALPAALDLGTKTIAFFLGGIGGFAGTVVLDNLTRWFLPGQKPRSAHAQ